jgi:hypothetical protein
MVFTLFFHGFFHGFPMNSSIYHMGFSSQVPVLVLRSSPPALRWSTRHPPPVALVKRALEVSRKWGMNFHLFCTIIHLINLITYLYGKITPFSLTKSSIYGLVNEIWSVKPSHRINEQLM